jgi:hypothetical protein
MTELRATVREQPTVYIQQIQRFTEVTHGPFACLTSTARECDKCLYILGNVSSVMKHISEHLATLMSTIISNKY